MEFTKLHQNISLFTCTEIVQKVIGDALLKWTGKPSWMNLVSSLVFVIISAVCCKKFERFSYMIILIGFLQSYDNLIKIYINLTSSSNLKEVVHQNMYMIFGSILMSYYFRTKYNKKQWIGMFIIISLGFIQCFIPQKNYKFMFLTRDWLNMLGSLATAASFILFRTKIEKKVENQWNYSFVLSVIISSFSVIYY